MMNDNNNDLHRPLLAVPEESDKDGSNVKGGSGTNGATGSELVATNHDIFSPRKVGRNENNIECQNKGDDDDIALAVCLICSIKFDGVDDGSHDDFEPDTWGDVSFGDAHCCGGSTWILGWIQSVVLLICLYIQFYLVYYGEVMVKHPDTNITVLVWHNTKRGILFFAIATFLYRRSRTMNTTVLGEDYCSIVMSMVLQLLPDITIIILLILLLFHMIVMAFLTMQLSAMVLFIIAMSNSCACAIHATTATTGTPTLPISYVKTEQANRTSSKQPIEPIDQLL
jgi:hypothetical protein